jgi:hypothetical protein
MAKEEWDAVLAAVRRVRPGTVDALMTQGPTCLEVPATRDVVVHCLFEEFTEAGLDADDEPSEYGRLIDDLIGRITAEYGDS